jgi:hypothetical protein
MPELPQYNDTRDTELRPSEAGIEANVQAGRRIGQFYDQAGADVGRDISGIGEAWEKHITVSQISAQALTYASGLNSLQDQWRQITSAPDFDPNDPTVRQKFMTERVAPFVQTFQKGYSTQEGQLHGAEQSAALIQHFNEQTIGDMSTIAGIAAKQNRMKESLFNQDTVYNNFTAVDTAIGSRRASTEALIQGHNFTGEQAALMRSEDDVEAGKYLIAAYKGAADRAIADPVNGASTLTALKAQLDNDKRFGLYGGGREGDTDSQGSINDYIDHATEVQGRVNKAAQETQKATAVASADQDYVNLAGQIRPYINAGKPVPPDLLVQIDKYGQAHGSVTEGASHFETLSNMTTSSIEKANDLTMQQSDPRVVSSLYANMRLAPGTPGRPTQATLDDAYHTQHTMSKTDYEQASSDLERGERDPAYEAGLKSLDAWISTNLKPKFGFKPSSDLTADDPTKVDINGTGVPPNAYTVYADAIRYAHEVFMSNVNAGLNPNQALDRMTNEAGGHSLTAHMPYWQAALRSPNASQYLGGHPQTEVEGGGTTPKNPGESQAAYLKRMGL